MKYVIKGIITAAIFYAALTWGITAAFGQNTPQYCSLLGSVYQTAADARDTNRSPDMALKLTTPYAAVIPEQLRVEIINQMYFDNRFAIARGEVLRVAVRDACMRPPQEWEPLQAKRGAP